MSDFVTALNRFDSLDSLELAKKSLVSDPNQIELRFDLIRSYQFKFRNYEDYDFITESIFWIILNASDYKTDGNWTEWQMHFQKSVDLKGKLLELLNKKLNTIELVDSPTLENFSNLLITLDLDLAIKCRKELYKRDQLSFDATYEYAHLLITFDTKKNAASDPHTAFGLFTQICNNCKDSLSLETRLLSEACKSALDCQNNAKIREWSNLLIERLKVPHPAHYSIFLKEANGVLARVAIYKNDTTSLLAYISELKNCPIQDMSDYLLYDYNLITELIKANKQDLLTDYIDSRFKFSESDQNIKETYLNIK